MPRWLLVCCCLSPVLNSSVSIGLSPSLCVSLAFSVSPGSPNKYPFSKLNLFNSFLFCPLVNIVFPIPYMSLPSLHPPPHSGFLKCHSPFGASPCHYSSPGFKMSLKSLLLSEFISIRPSHPGTLIPWLFFFFRSFSFFQPLFLAANGKKVILMLRE